MTRRKLRNPLTMDAWWAMLLAFALGLAVGWSGREVWRWWSGCCPDTTGHVLELRVLTEDGADG